MSKKNKNKSFKLRPGEIVALKLFEKFPAMNITAKDSEVILNALEVAYNQGYCEGTLFGNTDDSSCVGIGWRD